MDNPTQESPEQIQEQVKRVGFIKHIFTSLTPSFLIRNYFFGLCFLVPILYAFLSAEREFMAKDIFTMILFVVNFIFFPFATLIWDEIRDTLMGSTMIILPLYVMIIIKILIKGLIFCFAIPVGVLGILYIWFRTRHQR